MINAAVNPKYHRSRDCYFVDLKETEPSNDAKLVFIFNGFSWFAAKVLSYGRRYRVIITKASWYLHSTVIRKLDLVHGSLDCKYHIFNILCSQKLYDS